jgi:hypothetical protein
MAPLPGNPRQSGISSRCPAALCSKGNTLNIDFRQILNRLFQCILGHSIKKQFRLARRKELKFSVENWLKVLRKLAP